MNPENQIKSQSFNTVKNFLTKVLHKLEDLLNPLIGKPGVRKVKVFVLRVLIVLISALYQVWVGLNHYKKSVFVSVFLFVSLVIGGAFSFLYYKFSDISNLERLENSSLYQVPSILYDIQGRKITEFGVEKRIIIPYDKISPTIIDALIVAEDRDFWNHNGISISGIFRAIVVNILSGRVRQGGSTISQQLSKLLFTSRERSLSRKIQELFYALQIEKVFTKEEILTKYLNKVYYSNGVYGVEMASLFYFDKHAKDLNYAEAAFLISIPPSPVYYNPVYHPQRLKKKHWIVLEKLVEFNKISLTEARILYDNVWAIFLSKQLDGTFLAKKTESQSPYVGYITEYIQKIVNQQFPDKADALLSGGYSFYSTIDLSLQEKAFQVLTDTISRKEKESYLFVKKQKKDIFQKFSLDNIAHPDILAFFGIGLQDPRLQFEKGKIYQANEAEIQQAMDNLELFLFQVKDSSSKSFIANWKQKVSSIQEDKLEGSVVSIDNDSGRIYTFVGGSGFRQNNQLNRVYQARRQAGSSLKPFLYLAALETEQFTPASIISDSPIGFNINNSVWVPGNATRKYLGEITLRDALLKSLNIVSIKILQSIGIPTAIRSMSRVMNVPEDRFANNLTLALGTSEFSPLEMANAFAHIANEGHFVTPHILVSIKDRTGKTIWAPEIDILQQERVQLIEPKYAFLMKNILQDAARRGTASVSARIAGNVFHPHLGAKTGTTSNMTDAWMGGFSERMSSIVWLGFDRGTSLGPSDFGGVLAGPIWMQYMKYVLEVYPEDTSSPPSYPEQIETAYIHKDNGLLMPNYCRNSNLARFEWFAEGTAPQTVSPYCVGAKEYKIEKTKKSIKMSDLFSGIN